MQTLPRDKEFALALIAALSQRRRKSQDRLYRQTSELSGAKILMDHFKTEESLEKAGLLEQVKFLFGNDRISPKTRSRIALEWINLKLPHMTEVSDELLELITKVMESYEFHWC